MTASPIIVAIVQFFTIFLVGALPLTWKLEGKYFDSLLSFGAGVLLSAAFLHMLPASIPTLGTATGAFVLLGYLVMTLLERFTMAHPCGEDHCPNHRIGLVAFLGLSVHSVIAGMALGVGLRGAGDVSVTAALFAAILVHKVPETLALMGLLLATGWTRGQMISGLLIFSAIGPIGILLASFLDQTTPGLLSAALAVSTGTFIYIASSDLLPQLHRKMKQQWMHFFAFLGGILLLSFEAWHHLLGE
jgi:zinc transporter ZupT